MFSISVWNKFALLIIQIIWGPCSSMFCFINKLADKEFLSVKDNIQPVYFIMEPVRYCNWFKGELEE